MSSQNRKKGEYRPIYEALFHSPEYQRLSSDSRLILVTLKGLSGTIGVKPWPSLVATLQVLCGLSPRRIKTALDALEVEQWIEREGTLVWVVNGLRFEPQITLHQNHKVFVQQELAALPTCSLTDRFKAHYPEYFSVGPTVGPDKALPRATPTPPSANPSPPLPISASDEADRTNGRATAVGDPGAALDMPEIGKYRTCVWPSDRRVEFAQFPNPRLPERVAAQWEGLLAEVPDDLLPVVAGFIRAQQQPVLLIGTIAGIAERDDISGEAMALGIRDLVQKGVVTPNTRQIASFGSRAEEEARLNRVSRMAKSTAAEASSTVPKAPESVDPPVQLSSPLRPPVRAAVPLPGSRAARSGPQPVAGIADVVRSAGLGGAYDA